MTAAPDISNPFVNSVYGDAWETPKVTVLSINSSPYHLALDLLRQVCESKATISLLVHGEAGSGKTHLVARLREAVTVPGSLSLPSASQPIFCWVRLSTSAGRIWYYLRQELFKDLLRPVSGKLSQLDEIIRRRLPELFGSAQTEQGFFDYWVSGWLSNKHKVLKGRIEELAEASGIERDLREVLLHLHGENKQIARDWLKGEETLLPTDIQKLGLLVNGQSEQKIEDQSRKLVLSLCRLIGKEHPLVLCFDQIEGIEVGCADTTVMGKLVNLIGELHDQGGSAKLLISLILSSSHDRLKAAAGDPLFKRIAGHKANLQPLTWEEAVKVSLERMESVPALAAQRKLQTDKFWPLTESTLRQLYETHKGICTPRFWLEVCEKEFNRRTKPIPLDDLIRNEYATVCGGTKAPAVSDFDSVLAAGVPLLGGLMQPPFQVADPAALKQAFPTLELLFRLSSAGQYLGVRWFASDPHWRTLDALKRKWNPKKLQNLVLVFRTNPAKLEKAVKDRLADLQTAGVQVIQPNAEHLHQLTAFTALHSRAVSPQGFSLDGQVIRPQQLDTWARSEIGKGATGALVQVRDLMYLVFAQAVNPPVQLQPAPQPQQANLFSTGT